LKGKKTIGQEKKTLTPTDQIGKVGPTMGPPFLSIKIKINMASFFVNTKKNII
jgi:hypothetical protein